jgi:putative transposase
VENVLVGELTGLGLAQRRVLPLLGLASSTWHYRNHPRPRATDPVPQSQRAYTCRLDPVEQEQILHLLKVAFAGGDSVFQAWYDALDAGDPVASMSTWYRLARRLEPERPIRARRSRRATAMPQFEATRPNQVWCWDISKLPGTYLGQWYCLYVVLDVFSRYVLAWRVEEVEDDGLAKAMFEQAIVDQGGVVPRIVHSDGGASMMSTTLAELYRDLGITRSRNRPRVSNDNPHMESWFKTAKYSPGYPKSFADLDHARAWAQGIITPYNGDHHHSSLEGHTPQAVHDGSWIQTHRQREATMQTLALKHPDRYRGQQSLKTPYATVRLNQQKSEERLQTG